MKILMTGSNGFLGSHLKSHLESLNNEVIGFSSSEIDLRDSNSLNIFKNNKFDRIYHLAAWTQAGDFSIHNQGNEWLFNQLINTNILNYWKLYNPEAKFISFGTSCSYQEGSNLKEDDYFEGKPIDSLYVYGMTKRMLQIGVQAIHNQFNLNYLTLVPSTLYGNGYKIDDNKIPHFIFDLIKKIIKLKKYKTPAILWGDGSQIRELIHTKDFINYLVSLDLSSKNELFNIGAGEGHSIKHFTSIICDILDIKISDIKFDTNKFVGAKSKVLNINKLNSVIDNYKSINLREGIESIVKEFYKKL